MTKFSNVSKYKINMKLNTNNKITKEEIIETNAILNSIKSQAWWCTPVVLALGKLKQEELCESGASLNYLVRFCLKREKQKQNKKINIIKKD